MVNVDGMATMVGHKASNVPVFIGGQKFIIKEILAHPLLEADIIIGNAHPQYGKVILQNLQVWDIHPCESRHQTEPHKQDLDQRGLWRKYYKDKTVRKAIKVE